MDPATVAMAINGPIDPTVLCNQNNHCSNKFWVPCWNMVNSMMKILNGITSFHKDPTNTDYVPLHWRVVACLHEMGFGGLYRVGDMEIDQALMTTLVERWQPETHTFHLPIGEATVTLQDVALLWGLPIKGRPVTGCEPPAFTKEYFAQLCYRMLGFYLNLQKITGSTLKISALRSFMKDNKNEISEDSSDIEVLQRASCVILLLISCIGWPDTNGDAIQLLYLFNL